MSTGSTGVAARPGPLPVGRQTKVYGAMTIDLQRVAHERDLVRQGATRNQSATNEQEQLDVEE